MCAGITQLRALSPTPVFLCVRQAPYHLCVDGDGAYKPLPGELLIILNSPSQGDADPSPWLSERTIPGSSGLFYCSNHPVGSIFMTHPESGEIWAPASPSGHSTLWPCSSMLEYPLIPGHSAPLPHHWLREAHWLPD